MTIIFQGVWRSSATGTKRPEGYVRTLERKSNHGAGVSLRRKLGNMHELYHICQRIYDFLVHFDPERFVVGQLLLMLRSGRGSGEGGGGVGKGCVIVVVFVVVVAAVAPKEDGDDADDDAAAAAAVDAADTSTARGKR